MNYHETFAPVDRPETRESFQTFGNGADLSRQDHMCSLWNCPCLARFTTVRVRLDVLENRNLREQLGLPPLP